MKPEIPIWEKANLTLEEAAVYFNIGASTLRRLAAREDCTYVLWVGSKCLINRVSFEEYLQKAFSI